MALSAARRLGPVLLLLVTACGIYRVPVVAPLGPVPVRQALAQARDRNWRLRAATAGGSYDGRAAFVTDSSAQVGGHTLPLAEIQRLERWAPADLGGRPAGALVGGAVGLLLASANRSWWKFGFERNCDTRCTLAIYVPWTAGGALAGTMIGSAVHPPRGRWTTIWTRP